MEVKKGTNLKDPGTLEDEGKGDNKEIRRIGSKPQRPSVSHPATDVLSHLRQCTSQPQTYSSHLRQSVSQPQTYSSHLRQSPATDVFIPPQSASNKRIHPTSVSQQQTYSSHLRQPASQPQTYSKPA
ncbi:hypothetical protein Pcinc_016084 [Petrolisthes cinctipes]|uniref:Uncharacterized protein n=1 Tax=Petrolisthes cinctipes TaxID=88211 RepID=A0AAE1FT38_PETCI|nr:hypothetical protein Pcinc_016084 [Petrolisthes cinctipes]